MKQIDDGSANKKVSMSAFKSPKAMMRSPSKQNQPRSTKNQRARAKTFTFKKEESKKEDKVADSGIL